MTAAAAVLAVGVIVVLVIRDGDDPAAFSVTVSEGAVISGPEPRFAGDPPFRGAGAALGDRALLERAARAWLHKAQEDRSFPAPAESPHRDADEPRWRFAALWAGDRAGGPLVLLYSAGYVVRYQEAAAGRGAVVGEPEPIKRGVANSWSNQPLRLDDDGWLLTDVLRDATVRVVGTGVREERVTDGVLAVRGEALVVVTGSVWLLRRDAAFELVVTDALRAELADDDGARRVARALLAATAERDRYARAPYSQIAADRAPADLLWRGDLPHVGRLTAVVLDPGRTPAVAIGAGTGGALLAQGRRPSSTRSFDTGGRLPAPILAAGWTSGPNGDGPYALVVIGGPEIARLHVRIGTEQRTVAARVAAFSPAELRIPMDANGKLGEPPGAAVYGETADGTAVPVIGGWS
ncbi:hypothetical protein Voc01_101530 [Virgisporangium ochraceum]|uniref:Uncharacterized protein n=1 Tax=Virgisporangium ochraceum TaxID=65505 RepID=A0A8J4EI02_9ACTN|nr:hypothetical protein Voc01_101530 [Virgisporangium ochraceum]